jgi:hypothetical protein
MVGGMVSMVAADTGNFQNVVPQAVNASLQSSEATCSDVLKSGASLAPLLRVWGEVCSVLLPDEGG